MKKSYLPLTLILILAFALRLVNLATLPPSLNWDEVSHGYNAYSILKTGKDEWGQSFPLSNFRAYGDYPLPLYMYLSMPGILFFGLNEFSVRLPSAIFGSLLIAVVYLLTRRILKNSLAATVGAFLLAISPWSILTSRQVLQATPSIFFFSLGVYLFVKGLEDLKEVWAILGIVSLGLSAYAYHNTRILAPLFFAFLIFASRDILIKNKKLFLKLVFTAAVFFVPLIFIVLSPQGSARALWVGILDQGAINRIDESRGQSPLPSPLPKLIHNKITYSAVVFTENYLGYFNPYYLGFSGGSQYQFSVPGLGIIYPIELPFFYLGLIISLYKLARLNTNHKILLAWLFMGPLPAAITHDPYQVVRSMTLMPPLYIVTSFGFSTGYDFLKKRLPALKIPIIAILTLVLLLLFIRYLYNLSYIYPWRYSFAWQYGYKQAVGYIKQHQGEFSQIYMTKKYGEPHEFLLFYSQYDTKSYRDDPDLVRYERSDWFWVDGFSKYRFLNDWEVKDKAKCLGKDTKCLLITSLGNYPRGAVLLESIYFLDGSKAFDIVKL